MARKGLLEQQRIGAAVLSIVSGGSVSSDRQALHHGALSCSGVAGGAVPEPAGVALLALPPPEGRAGVHGQESFVKLWHCVNPAYGRRDGRGTHSLPNCRQDVFVVKPLDRAHWQLRGPEALDLHLPMTALAADV